MKAIAFGSLHANLKSFNMPLFEAKFGLYVLLSEDLLYNYVIYLLIELPINDGMTDGEH